MKGALLPTRSPEGAYTSSTMWVNWTVGANIFIYKKIISKRNLSKEIIRTYYILVRVKPVAREAWTLGRKLLISGRSDL
jgi:hypothetical protein